MKLRFTTIPPQVFEVVVVQFFLYNWRVYIKCAKAIQYICIVWYVPISYIYICIYIHFDTFLIRCINNYYINFKYSKNLRIQIFNVFYFFIQTLLVNIFYWAFVWYSLYLLWIDKRVIEIFLCRTDEKLERVLLEFVGVIVFAVQLKYYKRV